MLPGLGALDRIQYARAHVTSLETHDAASEAMAARATQALQLTRHALDRTLWARAHWQGLDLYFLPFFTLLNIV